MPRRAVEIFDSLDAAIVFTGGIAQLKAEPKTGGKRGRTTEFNRGNLSVGKQDLRPDGQVVGRHRAGNLLLDKRDLVRHRCKWKLMSC